MIMVIQVDLLGRLSPGYVESIIAQLHQALAEGYDPRILYDSYRTMIRACGTPREWEQSWEFETWIAMHQRLFITALATYVQGHRQA